MRPISANLPALLSWNCARRLGVFLLVLAGLAFTSPAISAPTDYQVKAVFLFNFAQFVEWPASAFTNETSPVVIGILGDDPFGSVLDQTVKGERARGRRIVVKRLSPDDSTEGCQILFISRSETDQIDSLLQNLKQTPVLTVSEAERFCERGGMVNFTRQDQNVRLEINRLVAESAGLKINSRLLGLARLVKSESLKD